MGSRLTAIVHAVKIHELDSEERLGFSAELFPLHSVFATLVVLHSKAF